MGHGGVDDHAEHAGLLGEPRHLDQARLAAAEVGAGCGRGVAEHVEEGLGRRDLGIAGIENDGREVEQHVVEHRREVGVAVDPQPERRHAAVEVEQQFLVVGGGVQGAHVPVAGAGRSPGRVQVVEQVRGAERRHLDAVERGARQLVPDERVGVVVGHPLGLAQHRSRRRLPVGPRVAVLRGREVQ